MLLRIELTELDDGTCFILGLLSSQSDAGDMVLMEQFDALMPLLQSGIANV